MSFFRQSIILVIIFSVFLAHVSSQDLSSDSRVFNLTRMLLQLDIPANDVVVDGFAEKISGMEINYHSPLPEPLNALISRATDGESFVSWKCGQIPSESKNIHLVWMAGLGSNLGNHQFDLIVNNEKWLTFSSSPERYWSIKSPNGSQLSFYSNYSDNVGDLFGMMHLKIPRTVIGSSQNLELRVTGRKEDSPAWYMVFMNSKLTELLERTKKQGFWYKIENNVDGSNATFLTTLNFVGKSLQLGDAASRLLNEEDGMAYVDLQGTDLQQTPLTIRLNGYVIDKVGKFSAMASGIKFYEDGKVVSRRYFSNNSIAVLEAGTSFNSGFVDDLNTLIKGPMSDVTLELITSSHQDIAWMDDPLACKIKRDTSIITPAIELLRKDQHYHYTAEQALMLYEYLDRHPKILPELQKYSAEGRLEWGASFNQPYEGMYYEESLIRQFYLGRKWLKKMLPGYDPKVYFNIDVPGRTTQLPQIAQKSGIDYMIISRHEKGYFFWQSPDGSQVGVHSPGHYHHASNFLRQSAQSAILQTPLQIKNRQDDFIKYQFPKQMPVLLSSDMSRPMDMQPVFDAWENIVLYSADGSKKHNLKVPNWRYNTFQPVLKELFSKGQNLPVLEGERPNVWLYIHGPTHYSAISASREGGRLLPVAEIYNTIAAVLKEDWESYPQKELNTAWQAQIYPDHGWGGNNGEVTDQLFKEKSEFSRDEAQRLIVQSTKEISTFIKADPQKGLALVVFNPLSWQRDALLETTLKFQSGEIQNLILSDSDGKQILADLIDHKRENNGYLSSVKIKAVLKNLPPVGYKTFYIKNIEDDSSMNFPDKKIVKRYENEFYQITFAAGGIEQIYDKSLNKDLARTDRFLFGELFALKSEGNGAGEFDAPQLPTTEYFEKLSQYKPKWNLTSESPFAKTFELQQKLNNSTVIERVIVFDTIKRIDFEVDILDWDGTKYREYRLAFPLNQNNAQVSYEVPFAKITVGEDEIPGAAGERYQQFAKDLHPREVLDWISSSNNKTGVTFSSDVAVWDYIDPTDNPVDYPILQPVLLASRRSCHGQGNWYLQEGDHHYRFSLTSHRPGWENGYQLAKGFNMAIPASLITETSASANLPESESFFNLSADNILLSTIKKAEDSDDIIFRVYEVEGKNTSTNLSWFNGIGYLHPTNLIEEENPDQPIFEEGLVKIGKFAIETFKRNNQQSN